MTALPFSYRQSRRRFLRSGLYAAGGVAALATSGLAWRAWDEDVFSPLDGQAYAPWSSWRTQPLEGAAGLVQMAILAASPHNTQPWLFHARAGGIDVFADRNRHLGAFDPYRREMQIGLGCAIENIVVAASAHSFAADVRYAPGRLGESPDNGMVPVAAITLRKARKENNTLFEAIAHRHTNRAAYDRSRPVPAVLTKRFAELAQTLDVRISLFETGPARDQFDRLVSDATAAIVADRMMERDSQHWFRNGPEAVAAHRDGLTLDTLGLPPFTLLAAKMLPPADAEATHRYWLTQTREVHLATARVTGLISVRDRYGAAENLAAGRVWQHMHLMATAEEIAMQPMNQPVEMADREWQTGQGSAFSDRLSALVGSREWRPTFAFRLGHPEREAPPSPRRGADDRLI